MLNRLFSTIKRGSRKIGQGGYTLIEVAAVVAITATLAAVIVPIAVDKVQSGKLVAAKLDVQTIAAGITAFNKDTGIWPAISLDAPAAGASVNGTDFAVLRSGNVKDSPDAIEVVRTLTGGFDPLVSVDTKWSGQFGHLNEQLVTRPLGLTVSFNWKGPYVESYKKRDPWGNNYLVFVKAMHTPTGEGAAVGEATKKYGWIISAGPDGVLQTEPTDSVIKNDDIGLMLFSATATRATP